MALIPLIFRLCFVTTFAVLLGNCHTNYKTRFSKFGVGFIVPSGWDVSSAYKVSNGNVVVICERKEIFTTNMITITVFNESSNLTSLLQNQITFYQETLAAMNPEFGPITNSTFKGKKSCKTEMKTRVSTIKNSGYLECFHANGKNVVLHVTENVADTSENKAPISRLLNSLRFKSAE
jgi:hypothetical protein